MITNSKRLAKRLGVLLSAKGPHALLDTDHQVVVSLRSGHEVCIVWRIPVGELCDRRLERDGLLHMLGELNGDRSAMGTSPPPSGAAPPAPAPAPAPVPPCSNLLNDIGTELAP